MDVLLAPVYESFLAERDACLAHGGFVVGPMGETTAGTLFEYCCEKGRKDPAFPHRFAFAPMLPAVVFETHVTTGTGGYRYMGLVDEIEINESYRRYRHEGMKPGRGPLGETADQERMPAFVRFKVLVPVSEIFPGTEKLRPGDLGQSESILRRFRFGDVRRTDLRLHFERLQRT